MLAYDELIKLYPDNTSYFIMKSNSNFILGDFLVEHNKFNDALLLYDELIKFNPDNRRIFEMKGYDKSYISLVSS